MPGTGTEICGGKGGWRPTLLGSAKGVTPDDVTLGGWVDVNVVAGDVDAGVRLRFEDVAVIGVLVKMPPSPSVSLSSSNSNPSFHDMFWAITGFGLLLDGKWSFCCEYSFVRYFCEVFLAPQTAVMSRVVASYSNSTLVAPTRRAHEEDYPCRGHDDRF
mgnify:CR=1 FL=1